jgi:predicted esterase
VNRKRKPAQSPAIAQKAFLVLFFICLWLLPNGIQAQSRQSYFDDDSRVLLPDEYDPQRSYPLIITLPWTGGSSEEFLAYYRRVFADVQAIFLLPPGRPQRSHYLPDFLSFVGWYDERILADLARVGRNYSVNPEAVYLMGYSLGGDLAWALINRHPRLFRGAAMFGTRSSYPSDPARLGELAGREGRTFFGIGDREHPDRSRGIQAAYRSMSRAGVAARIEEYSGGHTNPPDSLLRLALDWLEIPGPMVPGDLQSRDVASDRESMPDEAERSEPAPPVAESFARWSREAETFFAGGFPFDVDDDWDEWDSSEWDANSPGFFDDPDDFFD